MTNYTKTKTQKGLFSLNKQKMGWKSGGPPENFRIDGNMVSSPKKIADILANFFHDKVNNLLDKLPPQNGDPLLCQKEAVRRWGKDESSTKNGDFPCE